MFEKRINERLRCWDNGGKTFDRYTLIPAARFYQEFRERTGSFLWEAAGASEDPLHPQGFGQSTTAQPGDHLGKRVLLTDLPAPVQKFARHKFPELWTGVKCSRCMGRGYIAEARKNRKKGFNVRTCSTCQGGGIK